MKAINKRLRNNTHLAPVINGKIDGRENNQSFNIGQQQLQLLIVKAHVSSTLKCIHQGLTAVQLQVMNKEMLQQNNLKIVFTRDIKRINAISGAQVHYHFNKDQGTTTKAAEAIHKIAKHQ